MYDFAHVSAANDTLWTLIRRNLGYGPDRLNRDLDPWAVWESRDLVFSQTCGLPFRARLHASVQLVGTPDYGLAGCPAGHYNSVIVVPSTASGQNVNSLAQKRIAFNDPLSQSGWAAPLAHLQTADIPFKIGPCTGSHKASARAVATGQADFAAIDALTWEMLRIDDQKTTDLLNVVATTAPTPALPFITSLRHDANAIATAVSRAIDDLPKDLRERLHLKGLVQLPRSAYLDIPIPAMPR